jgi:hypothetical protein
MKYLLIKILMNNEELNTFNIKERIDRFLNL